jgi:transcriptional regulator with XRE-family HTH domain
MELDTGLKQAIADSGLTHYRIAKDAGITPGAIDRFVSGERSLNLETAAKIAAVLGYGLAKIAEPANEAPAKQAAKKAPKRK